MKKRILGLVLLVCASPAHAGVFLECRGHDDIHGFPSEHEVAILDREAEVDGARYRLLQTQTEFTLTGPSPKYDLAMYINRLTGEWAVTPNLDQPNSIGKTESSGKGEGCEVTKRKF